MFTAILQTVKKFPYPRPRAGTGVEPGQVSKWTVLLISAAGGFLMPLDTGMLSVAVPSIASALKADPGVAIWVPTAFLLTTAALMVPLGRLSDVLGRKKLFLLGLAISSVAPVVAGLSQSIYQIIGMRVVQAVGSALIHSNTWALVSEAFPSQERGKGLGMSQGANFLGLALGPVIGGLLVTHLGWRSIFFVLAPFNLFVMSLAATKLPPPPTSQRHHSYDFSGMFSFVTGLALVMVALSFGRVWGWTSATILTLFGSGAALLGFFSYIESRLASEPMLELSTFRRNSQFTIGNLANFFHYVSAHQSVTILIAFYVQWALHLSATAAGVVLLAKFFTMAAFSPLTGWLSDKVHPRWLCGLGMAFIFASLVLLSAMGTNVTMGGVFLRLLVLGVGIGLFASPNTNSVMGSVTRDKLGIASGTLGMMRSLGQTLGVAIIGGVLAGGAGAPDFEGRVRAAFAFMAAVAFVGMVVSSLRGRRAEAS